MFDNLRELVAQILLVPYRRVQVEYILVHELALVQSVVYLLVQLVELGVRHLRYRHLLCRSAVTILEVLEHLAEDAVQTSFFLNIKEEKSGKFWCESRSLDRTVSECLLHPLI